MILQEVFFRRYGARLANHLLKPNIFNLDKFEFPKNSIWNFVQYDGISIGPDTNDYLLRGITKKIFVAHQLELTSFIGTPRRLGVPLTPYVRQFHMQNKRFRLSMNLAENPRDENTLAIENYSLITKAYRYPRSIYSEYYKWKNIESTIWTKMHELASASARKQYYFMRLPKTLPSIQRLNIASVKFSQMVLNLFNSKESLFLLEFWKWLSLEHRAESVIGEWSQEDYNKINIVVEDNGSWMMFNLGLLNEWRYIEGVSDPKQKVKIEPIQMQKRFLRAMMLLMSYRAGEGEIAQGDAEDETEETEREIGSVSHDTKEVQDSLSNSGEYEKMLSNLDEDLKQLDVIEQETTDLLKAKDSDPNEEELTEKLEDNEDKAKIDEQQSKLKITKNKPALDFNSTSDTPDSDVSFQKFETKIDTAEAVKNKINNLADNGLIDGGEYRRKVKQIERFDELTSPEPDVKLKDYIKINEDDLHIDDSLENISLPDKDTVTDKSMLKSSLLEFDKKYITKVLKKDIVSMAVATQKAGFIVTDYDVTTVEDVVGKYDVHTMRVAPIEGLASTLRFRLPVVDDNGNYTVGATKYVCRKQRADLPIRKINPTRVALSSYYGKTFVIRSEKRVNNYAVWLHNKISLLSLQDDPTVTELHPTNVFDSLFKAPKAYSTIAQYLKSFNYHGFELNFDHQERSKIFTPEQLKTYEKAGSVLFGKSDDGKLLLMDKNSTVYEITSSNELLARGSIEEFLGIDSSASPIEFAEARIFGKNIPVGVVLAYKLGLSNLIELLGAEMRRVPVGQRQNLQPHEYAIVFSDETLIFSKDDVVASMILGGFRQYEKTTKNYSVYTFDKTGVYLKLLEQFNMSVRYLREIDLLDEMFVDPITEQILKEMKEPLTYRGLLIRSCELLMTDYHKDPLDMQEMRIKGYERFAGSVYAEVINAVREHRAKPNRKNSSIELNPYAVWKRIMQDPSALPANDLNPIQNLKEIEAVTYGGTGGRSSRAMVKSSRAFHENDIGVISEATSDSSDVAINTFLVADPKFTSLRGLTKKTSLSEVKPASLVSTSALLSVASNQDSAQRVNMISIQQSHAIACNGYKASAVRTGYEQVIAQRVGESFARVAKDKGKIIAVTDDSLLVEYSDGKKEGFQIGRKFGKSSDLTIPHELVTDYQAGQSFNKGDVLLYNSGFFEKDRFNPKSVVWKNSVTARVALMESRQTHEDASSISRQLAEKLTTKTTKVKNVVVNFNQQVRNVMTVGQQVDNDSVLCLIEDAVTAGANLFDEDTLNTLKNLSNQAPLAKTVGTIEKIEVFYHGDIEDMSSTLQTLSAYSDKEMRRQARSQNRTVFTGQVDESFRIDGEPLSLDSLVIRFYITGDVVASIGDKGVFANQLKTIFSEVMDYEVRTESGLKVDAIFGAQSIFNRIVNSAFVIGTTNTLLDVVGKKAAKIYRGQT